MYPLIKPFIDYTNAQLESFTRIARSPELADPTRAFQSDVFAQLAKANVENFSRFVQDYTRSLSALAFDTQGQLAKGIEAGSKHLQQAANTTSSIAGSAAQETGETMKNAVQDALAETDVALARASSRRG